MSNILTGSASGGKIKVDGVEVNGFKACAGKGESSGKVILINNELIYLADISPNIEAIIEQLNTVLTAISSGINTVYVAPGGAPGAGAGSIASACTSAKAELETLKAALI